jgi:hypothetical protein
MTDSDLGSESVASAATVRSDRWRTAATPAEIAARGPIGARVVQLRELSESDPERAQGEAWEWFNMLGATQDSESLNELFTLGVAKPMTGPTDGILLSFVNPVFHNVAMPFVGPGRPLQPWKGKTFESDTQTGANRFKAWFPPIARVVWPGYRGHRKDGGEHLLFDMETGDIPDPFDQSHTIWKIDYQELPDSPWLLRNCLDTLVEIVPDAYLGRLYVSRGGRYVMALYFALRPAA